MADAIWYFARGDTEHGPVTLAQIKALKNAGKLRADDLVWKEGMEDWAPADNIPELFGKKSSAKQERKQQSDVVPADPGRQEQNPAAPTRPALRVLQPARLCRRFGRPVLIVGFIIVLLAKGCDTAGNRYVARLQAKAKVSEDRFNDEWDDRRILLENEQADLTGGTSPSADETRRLREIEAELANLEDRKSEQRDELMRGAWRHSQSASRDAKANNHIWGFWRYVAFVIGCVVFCCGLLAVGFLGDNLERWFCLGMFAIVVFSLFVGGGAWKEMPLP